LVDRKSCASEAARMRRAAIGSFGEATRGSTGLPRFPGDCQKALATGLSLAVWLRSPVPSAPVRRRIPARIPSVGNPMDCPPPHQHQSARFLRRLAYWPLKARGGLLLPWHPARRAGRPRSRMEPAPPARHGRPGLPPLPPAAKRRAIARREFQYQHLSTILRPTVQVTKSGRLWRFPESPKGRFETAPQPICAVRLGRGSTLMARLARFVGHRNFTECILQAHQAIVKNSTPPCSPGAGGICLRAQPAAIFPSART